MPVTKNVPATTYPDSHLLFTHSSHTCHQKCTCHQIPQPHTFHSHVATIPATKKCTCHQIPQHHSFHTQQPYLSSKMYLPPDTTAPHLSFTHSNHTCHQKCTCHQIPQHHTFHSHTAAIPVIRNKPATTYHSLTPFIHTQQPYLSPKMYLPSDTTASYLSFTHSNHTCHRKCTCHQIPQPHTFHSHTATIPVTENVPAIRYHSLIPFIHTQQPYLSPKHIYLLITPAHLLHEHSYICQNSTTALCLIRTTVVDSSSTT